jgi:hypothetical protein
MCDLKLKNKEEQNLVRGGESFLANVGSVGTLMVEPILAPLFVVNFQLGGALIKASRCFWGIVGGRYLLRKNPFGNWWNIWPIFVSGMLHGEEHTCFVLDGMLPRVFAI